MIITTDLHLTDRERDEYRWEIFPWLFEKLEEGEALLILGDLTDAKDGHSAQLVDRIVRTLAEIPNNPIYILKGNHDYLDPTTPFFGFLDRIPGVRFFVEPAYETVEGVEILFLPHERRPVEAWEGLDLDSDLVVCHQTFDGAQASNGHKLQGGISRRYFSRRGYKGKVYSGDIHVPQICGDVTYVGTPYPVAFGDDYVPRVMTYGRKSGVTQLQPPTIRKVVRTLAMDDESDLADLRKGDQIKLRVQLDREDFASWEEIRASVVAAAESRGAYVHSIELEARPVVEKRKRGAKTERATPSDPRRLLDEFCEAHGLVEGERDAALDVLDRVRA